MSESELHISARDDISNAMEPITKAAVQPFHEKPSNRNRPLGDSRTQPSDSSRLLSIGSKENANNRNTIVIDTSDDDDDTRRLVPLPKSMVASSNPSRINGDSTNMIPEPKSALVKKKGSFIGVVLEPSPRMKRQSAKARGKMAESSKVDADVDEVMVLDQPSRSAETDHDSPVAVDKGKAKAAVAPTEPKTLSSTKQKQRAVIESETSDSAMDVDDGDNCEIQDVQPIQNSHQPSTPRRDPPRKLFGDDSNPFTTVPPQVRSTGATNPLSAFEIPYGRIPAEVTHALAEEEKEMTVEEWTNRESEIQLGMFMEHGLRKIHEFKERAAEVKRRIEAL